MEFYKFLIIFCIGLTINSCSTIPKPIEDHVTFPHIFKNVGYLEKYGRIGFDHIANLTVYKDKIVFLNEDVNLVIAFDKIEDMTYKKIFFTDPNNFIIISYRDGENIKKGMFTTFRFSGWVGGTSEIYDVIKLAYKRYKINNISQNN